MTLSEQLVAFAREAGPPPDAVRHAVRRHLLDGIGNALASARAGVVAPAVAVGTSFGGAGEATILDGGVRVPGPAAALANGALVHGLDFDDTHADALIHATAVVLPTALAVGEEVGATGESLLGAAVAGYETILRLGAAVPHGFHKRGFHATSVVGVFGSAMVAARILDLDADTTVQALGIAGSQAAGSLEFLVDGVSTKQLHPGLAAMNGILAARLAAAGATGPATILEGDAGLFSLYADGQPDHDRIVGGLGSRWELERITIKPYPVCQLSHAALDALATVRADIPDPHAVASLEVELPEDSMAIVAEPRDRKIRPQSTYDARFSLPFCLAVLLHHGRLGVDDLGPDQLVDPVLQATAARVQVHAVTPPGVAAAAPGRVRVVLQDATTIEGTVPASSGGPDRPLTDDQLVEKFVTNVGRASEDVVEFARSVLTLGDTADVRGLVRAASTLSTREPSDAVAQGVSR